MKSECEVEGVLDVEGVLEVEGVFEVEGVLEVEGVSRKGSGSHNWSPDKNVDGNTFQTTVGLEIFN